MQHIPCIFAAAICWLALPVAAQTAGEATGSVAPPLPGAITLVATTASADLSWPQWRGPARNDVSAETGLLPSWPEGGPRQVWLYRNAGVGYSGPAIANGLLYTMGSREGDTYLIALQIDTGREAWVTKLEESFTNNWGDGPRGTPTVSGDKIYALTGAGDLVCLRAAGGDIVWRKNMSELGGQIPKWGYAESVLVDGDRVICTPGGSGGTMAALHKETGERLWQSEEITDDAEYVSAILAEVDGQPQYVQMTMDHVFGIRPADGTLLWQTDWPGRVAVIPTPIYRDGKVYVTAGYGIGCMLIDIQADSPRIVYQNKVMKNHHGGVILLGDHLYGHSDPAGWTCQDWNSGETVWLEKESLGKGAVGYADGRFYCLDESSGTVVLIAATPSGWQEHGRFTLSPQTQLRKPAGRIWTHPVIVNGQLYLRDQDLIYCFDIAQQTSTAAR